MGPIEIIFGIALLVMALVLIIAISMQSGKEKGLSGTVAGGADTFFGKSNATAKEKLLSKVTTIVAIAFVVVVIAMYVVVS